MSARLGHCLQVPLEYKHISLSVKTFIYNQRQIVTTMTLMSVSLPVSQSFEMKIDATA